MTCGMRAGGGVLLPRSPTQSRSALVVVVPRAQNLSRLFVALLLLRRIHARYYATSSLLTERIVPPRMRCQLQSPSAAASKSEV